MPELFSLAGRSHQRLHLETLLKAQLAAGDVGGFLAKDWAAVKAAPESVVADGSPSAIMKHLQAAVFRAAISRNHATRQPHIPVT